MADNLAIKDGNGITRTIKAKDKGGVHTPEHGFSFADSMAIDAFARLRVSNPQTLFDSKQIFDDADIANNVENFPLFFDNQQTSGAGTATAFDVDRASTTLSVSNTTVGVRVRQTRERFNYQPGKSQLCVFTAIFGANAAGITRRKGLFDESNGLFFQQSGTILSVVRRSFATGAAVDVAVTQANWNTDKLDGTGGAGNPSGINLDLSKSQIFFIDFEWLSVGRVRYGLVVDGIPHICHELNNANSLDVAYMSTPNLPVRAEISNDGSGAASTFEDICSTVISEGGQHDTGAIHYLSTDGTHVDANVANTIYAVVGIRLRPTHLAADIEIINTTMISETNDDFEWILMFNPTVAGAFAYANFVNSALQVARGVTANTVTNGTPMSGGFSINAAPATAEIINELRLGSLIDGTPDEIVLCVRPLGSNEDIQGSITIRQLT
ncbi:hypothetical protein LCGC14_0463650 [marine sediment metagenome]|uniref:Uncharacterized protein n=1 Tax=marine sediment metagenome TaxID=412755 RepID=A0A0F9SX24_9ZZZZ